MQIVEMQIKDQAQKAVDYFVSGGNQIGGNKLTHNLNPYGIALKYIFAIRDLSFRDAAKLFQTTAQNVNYVANRMKKDRFDDFYIDKLCRQLNVDSRFFKDLASEIELIMEV